jgi:hypothetical protein
MKYSSCGKATWIWTPDPLGSRGYNVLGAMECSLINLSLIHRTYDWNIDEMERFSYRFCGEKNFMPVSNQGIIEIDDDYFNELYNLDK